MLLKPFPCVLRSPADQVAPYLPIYRYLLTERLPGAQYRLGSGKTLLKLKPHETRIAVARLIT